MQKMLGCGRAADKVSSGLAFDITKKSAALNMPVSVA